MKFKMPRQKISQKLIDFALKRVKQNKIYIPAAKRNILSEIASISRDIQKSGLPPYFLLRKLRGKLGYGIFLHPSAKPILKGGVIAPYSGEVYLAPQNHGEGSDYAFSLISNLTLTKEEQRIWDPKGRYHPRRHYALDLDAHKEGNFTRFINHSKKPNVEAQLLRIPGNSLGVTRAPFEIIYIAKKTIRPGEQLLVCYEGEDNSYWGALNIKPFPMTPKTFQLNSALRVISLLA